MLPACPPAAVRSSPYNALACRPQHTSSSLLHPVRLRNGAVGFAAMRAREWRVNKVNAACRYEERSPIKLDPGGSRGWCAPPKTHCRVVHSMLSATSRTNTLLLEGRGSGVRRSAYLVRLDL